MLLTDVWMRFIRQQLIANGQRTQLEARHKRDDRRFRLGRDRLRRCLVLAKPIPVGFLVGLSACRCSARDRPQRGIIRC